MQTNYEQILQLHSLVSKLLDSLCFQLCINKKDNNCLSLLQILLWKKKNEINALQFHQLYLSWLQSKSVHDLFTCQQVQIYPKHELIKEELVQYNYMTVNQITKSLQKLNETYNTIYRQHKPNNAHQIQQVQKIFSYLDGLGYIHLRLSSIFFFTAATLILDNITIPLTYDTFKIYMEEIRKQMCEIMGIVSLRCFKNYLLNLTSMKRNNYLQNIFTIFAEIQCMVGGQINTIPNLLDNVFQKWKNYSRFTSSSETKNNLERYKRIFSENQVVFYDGRAHVQYFVEKYGEEFVQCVNIDSSVLEQVSQLLKQLLNQYIDGFSKIAQKLNAKNTERNSNLVMTTHRNKRHNTAHLQNPQKKLVRLSAKYKTPIKHSKNRQYKAKTPTKSLHKENNYNDIKRQFGLSAQKIKMKNCNTFKDTTPTKSYRMVNYGLQHNETNLTQYNGTKVGVEKDSVYYKILFFRNKRVESYDVVMKRLKNK